MVFEAHVISFEFALNAEEGADMCNSLDGLSVSMPNYIVDIMCFNIIECLLIVINSWLWSYGYMTLISFLYDILCKFEELR